MFDALDLTQSIQDHGPVVRVVVADVKGSTPREAGTAMLVWKTGQSGTIGGGRLEYQAAEAARGMLVDESRSQVQRAALGPALNQCCGGAVTLVFERFSVEDLDVVGGHPVHARAVENTAGDMPPAMARMIARQSAMGREVPVTLSGGWLVEPVKIKTRTVVIYGAGHVGRALATVLAPLPELAIWIADTRPEFLRDLTSDARCFDDPTAAIDAAPADAVHLVMTHDHDLDFAVCHGVLNRSFGSAGLIGSATKWVRFRKRLKALGHAPAHVSRIQCPIGDPALGKHPQAIAIGVASALIRSETATIKSQEAC